MSRNKRKVGRALNILPHRLWIVLISIAILTGCTSQDPSIPADTPTQSAEASATTQSTPTITILPTATTETIEMTQAPTNEPASNTLIEEQKDLLFTRLDPDGTVLGNELMQAEPLLPAAEVGAMEVIAFEQRDPFVSLSFYIFDSSEAMNAAIEQLMTNTPATLPGNAELKVGGTSLILMLAYYYTDGSHGDANQALSDLYKWSTRVGGEE